MADASGSNRDGEAGQPSTSLFRAKEAKRKHQILIVEDNKADVFLIRQAIKGAKITAGIHLATDGEEASEFLSELEQQGTSCPDLVILDINLPRRSGGEVLRQLRETRHTANIAVLVITTSDSQADREAMGRLGINGYFRKPSSYDEFMKLGQIVPELLTAQSPKTL